MNTLISVEEARTLGRPIGDMKSDKILAYIKEVEQTQIKPVLGDDLYRRLLNEEGEDLDILLNGGEYNRCDSMHSFVGLKVAISYFVYVKVMMTGDIESTRFGFVEKQGQYSQHISSSQRSAAYNEATEVARHYLDECVDFCKAKGLIKTARRGLTSGGCVIRKIG